MIDGHLEICKVIIEKAENKNPPDQFHFTPLHYAAHFGYLEICKLIVDNVDDKNPLNNLGRTPYDLAKDENHDDILYLFE